MPRELKARISLSLVLRSRTFFERWPQISLVGRAFQVSTLPEILVQVPDQGTRLGADVSWAYRAIGERLFGRSESVCPRSNGVPTQHSDGCAARLLGRADILFGLREGDGSILARIEDTCAPVDAGPKSEIARRARVRIWSRCANATHVAVQARYEDEGLQSRRERGPYPVFMRNRLDTFHGIGIGRLNLMMSAPPLSVNSRDAAHVQTPRNLSPPDDICMMFRPRRVRVIHGEDVLA